MPSKLIIFTVALIVAGPALAAGGSSSAGGGSGGSSASAAASSGSSHPSGGGGSGGSGGGGHMGGGGSGAGAGLGGRGAAASARGAMAAHGDTLANHGAHEGALHGANAIAGKHAAGEHEHATSKLAATDRHHHPYRREPHYGRNTFPQYFESCKRIPDPFYPWLNCYGPTKSAAGSKGHS